MSTFSTPEDVEEFAEGPHKAQTDLWKRDGDRSAAHQLAQGRDIAADRAEVDQGLPVLRQRGGHGGHTFLNADGVPWENNMAERALRHLAVQRKISGSFFERSAGHYLLLLAISQTTVLILSTSR